MTMFLLFQLWDRFKMKTVKDCHYFHLKCSALLLADVFDKYKNISLKNYGL